MSTSAALEARTFTRNAANRASLDDVSYLFYLSTEATALSAAKDKITYPLHVRFIFRKHSKPHVVKRHTASPSFTQPNF